MNQRHRYRIRFSKQADLRMISHRDLLRLFERLFRRARLNLKLSEGYHPKPKISFPSALALGIAGLDEVMEVELAASADAEMLKQQLQARAPRGLTILTVKRCGPQEKKAEVKLNHYEVRVPSEHTAQVAQAIAQLLAAPEYMISRDENGGPIDARKSLADVSLDNQRLCFSLWATRERAVRPREILEILGLGQLEQSGTYLTRSQVALQTDESNITKETEVS